MSFIELCVFHIKFFLKFIKMFVKKNINNHDIYCNDLDVQAISKKKNKLH